MRIIEPNTSIPARPEPEVLVPPDDRIAFEHFIADFDGRQALVALTRRVPIQELRVAPLDVPDIQTEFDCSLIARDLRWLPRFDIGAGVLAYRDALRTGHAAL